MSLNFVPNCVARLEKSRTATIFLFVILTKRKLLDEIFLTVSQISRKFWFWERVSLFAKILKMYVRANPSHEMIYWLHFLSHWSHLLSFWMINIFVCAISKCYEINRIWQPWNRPQEDPRYQTRAICTYCMQNGAELQATCSYLLIWCTYFSIRNITRKSMLQNNWNMYFWKYTGILTLPGKSRII